MKEAILLLLLLLQLIHCRNVKDNTNLLNLIRINQNNSFENNTEQNISKFEINFGDVSLTKDDCPLNDALSCYLYNLVVHIPDQTFKKGLISVKIKEFRCTNFILQNLESTNNHDDIQVNLNGLQANCQGVYISGLSSGNISAQMENSSLEMIFQFTSSGTQNNIAPLLSDVSRGGSRSGSKSLLMIADSLVDSSTSDDLPRNTILQSCTCLFHVPSSKMEFSGSASSVILNLFAGPISKAAEKELNAQTCPNIQHNTQPLLTRYTQLTNEYIHNLINTSHPTTVDPDPKDFEAKYSVKVLQWESVKLFHKVLHIVNGFLKFKFVRVYVDSYIQKYLAMHNNEFFLKLGLDVKVPLGSDKNLTLSFESMKLSELTNFSLQNLEFLKPSNKSAVVNGVQLVGNVKVSVAMGVLVEGGDDNSPVTTDHDLTRSTILNETLTVSTLVSNSTLKARVWFGLARDQFLEMNVAEACTKGCALETLLDANVTSLFSDVVLQNIQIVPRKADILEVGIDQLLNNVFTVLIERYQGTLTRTIHALMEGPIRSYINNMLDKFFQKVSTIKSCQPPVVSNETKWFNFYQSRVVEFIDRELTGEHGVNLVNSAMEAMNRFFVDHHLFDGDLYHSKLDKFDIMVTGQHLHLENINSFYHFDLLKTSPKKPYYLWNDFAVGSCNGTLSHTDIPSCHAFTPSLTYKFDYVQDDLSEVQDIYNVTIGAGNLEGQVGVQIQYDTNAFKRLSLSQIQHEMCLFVPAKSLAVNGVQASLGAFDSIIGYSIGSGTNAGNYVKHLGRDQFTVALNHSLYNSASDIERILNQYFIRRMKNAPAACKNSTAPPYSPTPAPRPSPQIDKDKLLRYVGLLSTFSIFAFSIGACLRLAFRDDDCDNNDSESHECELLISSENLQLTPEGINKDGLTEPLQLTPEGIKKDELTEPLLKQGADTSISDDVNGYDEYQVYSKSLQSALMNEPEVPVLIKLLIPLMIVGTIGMFLFSNFHTGATVDGKLSSSIAGKSMEPEKPIYAFSLMSILRDMWKAKTYFLLCLIFVMSVCVPYLKLLLMFYSWISPIAKCPPPARENMLVFLESIGKYSLVDAYVLVLMIVSFRYHLGVDLAKFTLIRVMANVDIYTNPRSGFYCFLGATTSSILLGHVVFYFHRKVTIEKAPPSTSRKVPLHDHDFAKTGTLALRFSRSGKRFMALLLISSIILIIVGASVKSFDFKFSGLASLPLEDTRKAYSLLSIGRALPESVENSSGFGTRWIQWSYFFFGVVMPLACLISLFVVFYVPLDLKLQSKLFYVSEVSNAWCALEVFVISLVAAIAEISDVATYIVQDTCSGDIETLISSSFILQDLLKNKEYCFDVVARIKWSSWVLFCGVALNWIVTFYCIRIGHQALHERLEREGVPINRVQKSHIIHYQCHVRAADIVSSIHRWRISRWIFEEVNLNENNNNNEVEVDYEVVIDR